MLDEQSFFNLLVTVIGVVGGWFLKVIYSTLVELRNKDEMISKKVSEIELVVAGHYVRKSEVEKGFDQLNGKLDKITDKLDQKVDK